MHKIIFSETALRTFSLYFTRYKQYYIERFSDTGIQDEYLIQQNYHNTADKLVNVIFSSIHTIFSADLIYWRHIHEDEPKKFTLIRTIKDRTLIIEYTEDIVKRVRTIESLQIMRE